MVELRALRLREMLGRLLTVSFVLIRHRFHHRMSEWGCAIALTLAGWQLLRDQGTFELGAYDVLRQIAGQDVWAAVLFWLGIARLIVLIINGALERGSPHLRAVLAYFSTLVWFLLLANFWLFDPPLLIAGFVAACLFMDSASAYRAAQDAAREDKNSGGGSHGTPAR